MHTCLASCLHARLTASWPRHQDPNLLGASHGKDLDAKIKQELELREAEEAEWGEVLRVTQRGVAGSRSLLWEEAAQKVAAMLSSPAAWDGDHFLQACLFPPL